MQTPDIVSSSILADLLRESVTQKLQNLTNNKTPFETWLDRLTDKENPLSSIVDRDTLQGLIDGEYDISLENYTDMHTYNLMMSNLYGNNSLNFFQNSINNLLGNSENTIASAKSFVDTMRARGLSNSDALRLYTAMKSYSAMSSLGNFSYVNAKI